MNSTHPLSGKTILVTGATNGIGRAAALELAKSGAQVVVGGRSLLRCEDTQRDIAAITGQMPACFPCDFSSLDSVRKGAQKYLESGQPLDVLINNAGAFFTKRMETHDRIEASFGINHLAPFLLTGMLLPRLRESGVSRIVVVASDAHRFGAPLKLNDLQLEKGYGPFKAYGRSKGANILFTRALARRLGNSGTTVNAMHPGAVNTNLGNIQNVVLKKLMALLMRPFFRPPEKGAETILWLASSPEMQGQSGGYYMDCRPHRLHSYIADDELAEGLWRASEELTGFTYPASP